MNKYVYAFKEGNKDMKNLLGGKGANLAEMKKLNLPIPDGFTVTTEACTDYYSSQKQINEEIISEVWNNVLELQEKSGKKFGDINNPLLVSVRSGARVSMPGMMDTVLNLGLNDLVAQGFATATNNKRFVYDSYRRFIMMFADVVKGYDKSQFERVLDEYKKEHNYTSDIDLTGDDWQIITDKFKNIYQAVSKEEFPQDPKTQLFEAITAVFRSWDNERAIEYRKIYGIPSSWGTAVNVQEMVYGNRGENSGTGVAFTRSPATGEKKLYGEFLINAQGEDVVAGVRTPENITTLENIMPKVYQEFLNICKTLENHYRDMQDMEFTIENGKLYMLQTRNGKRTAQAALKIAVDLVAEGMLTKEEAIMKVEPHQLDQLLHPTFAEEALKKAKVLTTSLAASPGAATGKIYFDAKTVSEAKEKGEKAILVRLETSPEDIKGMNDAEGILTIRGGMTSHAAVVARGMGKCCVCGAGELTINEKEHLLITKDNQVFKEGDYISLDGSTGTVYEGKIATVTPPISADFETLMNWADEVRTLKVRTNADTAKDVKQALLYKAEGIGLCRTEHMFFEADRIFSFRKMILAQTLEERETALANILPYQRKDFEDIYRAMNGLPVVIRYLDPPLHEFLPKTEEEILILARDLNITSESLKNRIETLKEFNPMMGHRGCRLAISYPEIAIMQTKAIIEAAINVSREGINITPEMMVPLVGDVKEFEFVKSIITRTADKIITEANVDMHYEIGTMIEIPRAAITADEIAKEAEFFSFGTNDLTQYGFGFSRDDASKFLNHYYENKIFEQDPFATIDQKGVGALMKIAVEKGRSTNPNLIIGICGEHGGESASIEFCHSLGLDYVSCSPFRVPLARLSAAQAQIKVLTMKNE